MEDWLCGAWLSIVVVLLVVAFCGWANQLEDLHQEELRVLHEAVRVKEAKLRRPEAALAVARHNLRSAARWRQAEVRGVREVHALDVQACSP